MKSLYTLSFLCLIALISRSQSFTVNFEDTTATNHYFYTDSTIDPQGIWQIGPPHKSFMNSALTQPNGVVTLLDSLLPPGRMGSFIITLPNVQLGPSEGGIFSFAHRFQFDSIHGGGYVEFSVDSGIHWHGIYGDTVRVTCENFWWYWGGVNAQFDTVDGQIIPTPKWWDNVHKDTTPAGTLYFTGTDSTWIYDTIVFPIFLIAEKTSQLTQFMFRFTAYTDSLSPPLGGWLIDNINYSATNIGCGGGINEINSSHIKVYPDPVTDAFTVSLTDAGVHDYSLSLIDLTGREILYKYENKPEVMLNRGDIAAGSYIIKVIDEQTGNTMEKRVVFE